MSGNRHGDVTTKMRAFLVLAQILLTSAQFPDLEFTCPAWGCSARGTFSLPTPVPGLKPVTKWNWTEDVVVYGNPDFQSRGCTSSLTTLACPTSEGYVTLEVKSGHQVLAKRHSQPPFLPIVDFYGNILQSDADKFTFVTGKGVVETYLNLTSFQPEFGASISYERTVLMPSSNLSTAQLITFGELGSIFSSTYLNGTLGSTRGTFVTCGHPLIDFERAYIVTRFIPNSFDDPAALKVYGQRRLYAIDLSGNQTANSIAWHFDLPGFSDLSPTINPRNFSTSTYFETFLAFFNNTIYINYATQPDQNRSIRNNNRAGVPSPPILCGVQDNRKSPKLMFSTVSVYGPMSLCSITESWTGVNATGPRTVWVTDRSNPTVISGFDAVSGKFLVAIKLDEISGARNLGQVTSYVSVTRQADHTNRDVLVFGTQDGDGQAYLVTLEAGLPPVKPRLLWSLNMSGPRRVPGRPSQWVIGGQIASVAFPKDSQGDKVQYGLAVSVVEGLPWVNASQVHVRLIV